MVTVECAVGLVDGLIEDVSGAPATRVAVFRGIRYAKPPVGDLRFRPPQPVTPWTGVAKAHEFGPAPPQPLGDPLGGLVPGMSPATTDEDCLTLNVWTPAGFDPAHRRPTLVWLHGGAFSIGASSLATYDAALLVARHDVVVVSLNYRLGALGFLLLESAQAEGASSSANLGLQDQALGLSWVRDNIVAFGGDPENVTIFGESAGAGSALHLLTSPIGRGLFRRAILQSPGVGQSLTVDQARSVTACFLTKLTGSDLAAAAARARRAPVSAILAAQAETMAALLPTIGPMPFHPVVDGTVVPEDPLAGLQAGRAADVELILGTTSEEMRLFLQPGLDSLGRSDLVAVAGGILARRDPSSPSSGEEVVAGYEHELGHDSGLDPARLWGAIATDAMMRLPASAALDGQGAVQPRTYGYTFTWPAPGRDGRLGAAHATDLPFTFGTFDRVGWGAFVGAEDALALRLSEAMMASWAAFARCGDPSTDLVGSWPPYGRQRRLMMELGRRLGVVEDPMAAVRAVWERRAISPTPSRSR